MYTSLMADMIGITAPPDGTLAVAARHGFGGLDLRLVRYLDWLNDFGPDRFADEIGSAGLRPGYASMLTRTLSARPEDWAEAMEQLPTVAAMAERLGYRCAGVVVLPFDDGLDLAANWRHHLVRLREAAPVLADHGVRLGLEYVSPETRRADAAFEFVHDLATMRELIAESAQPNVGLMLDSFHWHAAGETEADLRGLSAAEVVNVHLNDAPRGTPMAELDVRERELPGATGVIDLAAFMRALSAIGYAGPLSAEPTNDRWPATPVEDAAAQTSAALSAALALADASDETEDPR